MPTSTIRRLFFLQIVIATLCAFALQTAIAQAPPQVLAFYSDTVEPDHVTFAHQAIAFYTALAQRDHFTFAATTDWSRIASLSPAQTPLILWLNDQPHTPQQQAAFEHYMTTGGGWIGFHASAYNDADTHWPWFVHFLGGAVFSGNNWPPLPATLIVNDTHHPATHRLPATLLAPANEWYSWQPSPRLDPGVKVLLTLSPTNFPLGLKDTLVAGDVPVVWTNTRYRMLYANMGHGDKIFTSDTQNRLFEDAVLWLLHPAPR
jgi:hypothetical protein